MCNCIETIVSCGKGSASVGNQSTEQYRPPAYTGQLFPAGDEQTLVYEVTGRVVPPAGIPIRVGCVVSNIATILCIHQALADLPFTQKYLTVTGEVHEPVIVKAPIGTPVRDCIELAGGPAVSDYVVINGGPMMGKLMTREQAENAFVTKRCPVWSCFPQIMLSRSASRPGLSIC